VAVGEVLRRRASIKGFAGCKYAETRIKPSVLRRARKAWRLSRFTNYSRGATHFDGAAFPRPKWSKKMKKVAVIGNQIFWKA
jgi:spore germination cell wall hydrolase CwlJ-like protein